MSPHIVEFYEFFSVITNEWIGEFFFINELLMTLDRVDTYTKNERLIFYVLPIITDGLSLLSSSRSVVLWVKYKDYFFAS